MGYPVVHFEIGYRNNAKTEQFFSEGVARYMTRCTGSAAATALSIASRKSSPRISTGEPCQVNSRRTISQSSDTQAPWNMRYSATSSEPLIATLIDSSPNESTTPWSIRPLPYLIKIIRNHNAPIEGHAVPGKLSIQAGENVPRQFRAWQALHLAPAAAQRAIELHHGHAFLQTQLRQGELAGEQVALRVEHLEVAIEAAAIA
jgi:hypothetical protein